MATPSPTWAHVVFNCSFKSCSLMSLAQLSAEHRLFLNKHVKFTAWYGCGKSCKLRHPKESVVMSCVRAGSLFAAHPSRRAARPLGNCLCPLAHRPRRAQQRHHFDSCAQRRPPWQQIRCSRRGKSCKSQDVIAQQSTVACEPARFLSNIHRKAGGDQISNDGWPTSLRPRDRHLSRGGKKLGHAHH